MRILQCIVAFSLCSCISKKAKSVPYNFSTVEIQTILEDSISIRAIALDTDFLMYAGNAGKYGYFEINKIFDFKKRSIKKIDFGDTIPNFRAIASNSTHFFILSIESPAVLFKVHKESGAIKLVYKEIHDTVFYDAMTFWNDKEGIAIGDPTDNCLSIIITRDGGESWNKLSCDTLPKTVEGEAAFAASNGNIAVVGDKVWVVSGGMNSRVFYSPDKGVTWEVFETPVIQGTATTGAYSIDFYDERNGVIFGGDYTNPDANFKNKAVTIDGGHTWSFIANGKAPGYKSSVQYMPNTSGKKMVAVGFSGISISNDAGNIWNTISNESFYTIRFLNDTIAVAAGKNRIAKLVLDKQRFFNT